MAAFFENPAPSGGDASRAGPRPVLRCAWRVDAGGRLVGRWVEETAQIMAFRTRQPATARAAAAERAQAHSDGEARHGAV